jgi:hypothetical protein
MGKSQSQSFTSGSTAADATTKLPVFSYDTDPKQAVASRLRVFDMVASQKIPLLAYHFPWPGSLGKQADGYRYYPTPMEIVTIPPKT